MHSAALAQAPSITHVTPAAVHAGATTVITLHGQNLAAPTGLWTSFAATTKLADNPSGNGQDKAQVTYQVTLPSDVAPGIVGVRLGTGAGISNLQLLLIDPLPSIADTRQSRSLETAQAITLPAAIDGACEAESSRWYKFNAAKGDRLSVEAVARRLGSQLDPQIRLLDEAGRELALSDDEPTLARDCRFAVTIPADGTYRVEIRDVGFQGGVGYRYRLRIGDFPLLTAPFPLAVREKTAAQLQIVGPQTSTTPVTIPLTPAASGPLRIATGVAVLVCDLPEQIEAESNDGPAQSTVLALPCGVSGRFAQPRDRDYYHFTAKAGERISVAGQSHVCGSPSELYLQLFSADGKPIARSDDARASDGDFVATIPADGVYRLIAEDLHHRGGPEFVYRVEIRPFEPGFALAVDRDRASPPQGGVLAVKVTATRREYNEPIALSVGGLGDGVTLTGETIAAGANETTLKITLPAALAAGSLHQLSITGIGTAGGRTITALATTAGALRRENPALAVVPPGLDRTVGVGIGPVFPPYYQLTLEPADPLLPQLVLASTFKVKAQRLNNFADQIEIAIAGLPAGVEAKVAPIAKGQAEATISLTAKNPIELGAAPLRITASAVFQDQPRTVVLEPTLRIIRPLVVALKPAGILAAGGKQTLEAQLTRFGPNPAPVKLTLKNLPVGVTGPVEVVIPADKSEIDLEISAAANAPASKSPAAIATAVTTVQGEAVTVDSAPVIIEVGPAQ